MLDFDQMLDFESFDQMSRLDQMVSRRRGRAADEPTAEVAADEPSRRRAENIIYFSYSGGV